MPVVPAYDAECGRILMTTSVAYPAKLRNISKDPEVLVHFHHEVASRKREVDPPAIAIRAKASVIEGDIVETFRAIGRYFRSTPVQPTLYERLRRWHWRWLYRYYFSRYLIELTPEDVLESGSIPREGEVDPSLFRRPDRAVGPLARLILARAPAASLAVRHPRSGLAVSEAIIQAALPTLVCAELASGAEILQGSRLARFKACISSFWQSPDFSSLGHCSVLGLAEIRGQQVRLRPRAYFTTIRPPGVLGDLWTGVDSTLRGARQAASKGVEPIPESVLEAAFGKGKGKP